VRSDGSVSRWLDPLQQGDAEAVQQLWQRYFAALAKVARRALRDLPLRARDDEDVALSAFDSFCRNAARGRFPQLSDRDDLWRLLTVITVRKAHRLRRDESRQKRGGPQRLTGAQADDETALLEQALSHEPSPEMVAQMAEEYERLLQLLGEEDLRRIAVLRMEGHSVEEAAAALGCAPRSVKRKLQLIRTLWQHEAPP
jgi:DNA-directed RNA polymerase specialized sigma24 family protein